MTGAYVRIRLGQRPYGPGRNGSLTGRAVRGATHGAGRACAAGRVRRRGLTPGILTWLS